MPRIPLVDPARLTGELAQAYQTPAGRSSFFRLLAQAPTAYAAYRPFINAVFAELSLDRQDRELVVLLTVSLERGGYQWAQHLRIAPTMGIAQRQIDAIAARDLGAPYFDEKRAALLAFTRQVVENVRVDDATFAAMRQHYDDREIVETLFAIGNYMLLARISEVAQLELDELNGIDAMRAAEAAAREKRNP